MSYSEKLTSYVKDKSGNTAMMFVVALMGVVGCVGAAVDTNMAARNNMRMQNISDAAALAASRSGETALADLEKIAQAHVDAHSGASSSLPNLKTEVSLVPGGEVQVRLTSQYQTKFMHLFGRKQLAINTLSAAPIASRAPVNIALVLDVTGSMKGDKIKTMRAATTALLTELEQSNAQIKVSVVPFAQYVNIGASSASADWIDTNTTAAAWNGCAGSRANPWHRRADHRNKPIPALTGKSCGAPIVPLTGDLASVKTAIDGLSANGSTYIPSGIIWGWRTLTTAAPFARTASPSDATTQNVMIVMTDGANTRAKSGATHDGNSVSNANQTTRNLCQAAKTDGVDIYTIAYEINDAPTKALMRGCANQSSMYFDAANSAGLYAAFKNIAAGLLQVRLTN